MKAPVLASDLRTRTALRVFSCARGGSIAVDHPLWLIGRESLFITGGPGLFVATFEGTSTACATYGDAVEMIRCGIGAVLRNDL